MLLEVRDRDDRVVARMVHCCLCETYVPLAKLRVFRGPGQRVPCCADCLAEFETWCEGRSAESEAA